MQPPVSVIVTTKNEEKNIESCLKSIQEQTYKNIEIIVVDNNSTDKTREEVDRMGHSRTFDPFCRDALQCVSTWGGPAPEWGNPGEK